MLKKTYSMNRPGGAEYWEYFNGDVMVAVIGHALNQFSKYDLECHTSCTVTHHESLCEAETEMMERLKRWNLNRSKKQTD